MSEELIEALRTILGEDDSVVLAYAFGSVARGEGSHGSDLDVAVLTRAWLGPGGVALLAERIARALPHRHRIDLVDLRAASPVLAAEIVRDGVVVVERAADLRFDFEMRTVHRFEDTKALRRIQRRLLREAARGVA